MAKGHHLGAIFFRCNHKLLEPMRATNPGGNARPGEEPLNVLSKETHTKWMDPKKCPLKVKFAVPTSVDSYILMTAFNEPRMDILRWQVSVSNDDKDYQIVHRIEDIDFPLTISRSC